MAQDRLCSEYVGAAHLAGPSYERATQHGMLHCGRSLLVVASTPGRSGDSTHKTGCSMAVRQQRQPSTTDATHGAALIQCCSMKYNDRSTASTAIDPQTGVGAQQHLKWDSLQLQEAQLAGEDVACC